MATTESFSAMLKHYMPHQLLVEELKRRNYMWQFLSKDEKWMGGQYDVPFMGSQASSLSFGSLTDSSDVSQDVPVLGYVSAQPELWGSMKFNEKDLDRHGSMEASFLKILPDRLRQFSDRMAERISLSLLKGHVSKLTATGGNGSITLDHPEFLEGGEKVSVVDSAATVAGYIRLINMNTKVATIYSARSGGTAMDCSALTVAQGAKVYIAGQETLGFTTLKSALLSAANGGGASLHNQTKVNYPFLQAINISGAAYSQSEILENLYDAFFEVESLGKSNGNEIWVSRKHLKNIVKGLELSRNFTKSDSNAGFGFSSVKLVGADGSDMKIVGLREMDDSEAFIVQKNSMVFAGNNFFERKRHLNGEEFFLERATTGYSYLCDIKFFGDLIVHRPSTMGAVHSIANY